MSAEIEDSTAALEIYAADFAEEPGYLNFAAVGPLGRAVIAEEAALRHVLEHARFGAMDEFEVQDERMRRAVAGLIRFRRDQVVFQPSTSQGLMHAAFGVTGEIAVAPGEFPALTYAVQRAYDALGAVRPRWLETDHGRVTPGSIRAQLDASVAAVAVGLVDFRTGHLVDLDGIRQVIGDRVLIVDAAQGFGVVDAPWEVADVIASGGQKWARAGWGTGFLALSDRAIERMTPVWSGATGSGEPEPLDVVRDPVRAADAFEVSRADPIAQARLAVAVERIAAVGVRALAERVAERVSRIIDLADEFGVPVSSPRAEEERAGIVVLSPDADRLTSLTAALHNHGVSSTQRGGAIRLSAHVSTDEETLGLLRSAFVSFGTTVAP